MWFVSSVSFVRLCDNEGHTGPPDVQPYISVKEGDEMNMRSTKVSCFIFTNRFSGSV